MINQSGSRAIKIPTTFRGPFKTIRAKIETVKDQIEILTLWYTDAPTNAVTDIAQELEKLQTYIEQLNPMFKNWYQADYDKWSSLVAQKQATQNNVQSPQNNTPAVPISGDSPLDDVTAAVNNDDGPNVDNIPEEIYTRLDEENKKQDEQEKEAKIIPEEVYSKIDEEKQKQEDEEQKTQSMDFEALKDFDDSRPDLPSVASDIVPKPVEIPPVGWAPLDLLLNKEEEINQKEEKQEEVNDIAVPKYLLISDKAEILAKQLAKQLDIEYIKRLNGEDKKVVYEYIQSNKNKRFIPLIEKDQAFSCISMKDLNELLSNAEKIEGRFYDRDTGYCIEYNIDQGMMELGSQFLDPNPVVIQKAQQSILANEKVNNDIQKIEFSKFIAHKKRKDQTAEKQKEIEKAKLEQQKAIAQKEAEKENNKRDFYNENNIANSTKMEQERLEWLAELQQATEYLELAKDYKSKNKIVSDVLLEKANLILEQNQPNFQKLTLDDLEGLDNDIFSRSR